MTPIVSNAYRPACLHPFWLICFILAGLSLQTAGAESHDDPKSSYDKLKIEGFTVLISGRYQKDSMLRQIVIEEVQVQLRRIALLMQPHIIKAFRKVEIWVEKDYPGRCQYHPSASWLKRNGYTPEKARSVEVPKSRSPLRWRYNTTMILLHELIHAYHHQVLGFNEPRIKAAYERYKASGAGEKVVRNTGHTTRHYALKNKQEFFAEMSEAYLWVNDFYPFVYGELKVSDPQTTKLLEDIWGKRK